MTLYDRNGRIRRTPTYRAQCKSWAIAKHLFGITDAGRCDMSKPPTGLMLFRALPKRRDEEALRLRKMVADEIRDMRNA